MLRRGDKRAPNRVRVNEGTPALLTTVAYGQSYLGLISTGSPTTVSVAFRLACGGNAGRETLFMLYGKADHLRLNGSGSLPSALLA